jgi:predicted MFS family arabinose efflux permease
VGLLCAAFVLAAAFVLWERRTPNPLLDVKLFRSVWFTVPNIVAFCTYFATFAIFFFTALYLDEVVMASGYRIALVFAPMTVLMILSSLLAGYLASVVGPRWLIVGGCAAFAAGLLLANPLITPHPNYVLLGLALALAGIGIGITVVPVTATVLDAVPPERSGMAASAANTSREIGAVTGVAVLGALVFSQVNANITSHLEALHVSASAKAQILGYKAIIIQFIETGQATGITASNYNTHSGVVGEVVGAAYGAFSDGVHAALYVSGGLMIFAGLLAAIALRAHARS